MEYSQISEYMKKQHNVTDYTKDDHCSCCGNCCSNRLPLIPSDIARIKAYLKKNHIKPTIRGLVYKEPVLDMICPFLDDNTKKCKIYAIRPKVCQLFICNKTAIQIAENWGQERNMAQIYNIRELFFNKTST